MRYWTLLYRALRLRCPLCGQGRLFRNWLAMRSHCPQCGLLLEREPGFFLGSIYFNYGLTAIIAIAFYLTFWLGGWLSERTVIFITLTFVIVFPIWFFRYARSLWLSFDQYWDPRSPLDAATRSDWPNKPSSR